MLGGLEISLRIGATMGADENVPDWKMSRVETLANRFEEDMVSQALEKAGIPFLIRRYSDTAYDGLFIPQKGWASVMVPEELVDKAKAVVGTVQKDFEKKESEVRRRETEDRSQKSEEKRQKWPPLTPSAIEGIIKGDSRGK
jgi:hypothetical protein